jgi:hypothetical protein
MIKIEPIEVSIKEDGFLRLRVYENSFSFSRIASELLGIKAGDAVRFAFTNPIQADFSFLLVAKDPNGIKIRSAGHGVYMVRNKELMDKVLVRYSLTRGEVRGLLFKARLAPGSDLPYIENQIGNEVFKYYVFGIPQKIKK